MSWFCITNSKLCRKLNLNCFFLTPFPFFKEEEPQVTDYPVLLTFLNQTIGIFVITLLVMLLFIVPLLDTFGTYGLFLFSLVCFFSQPLWFFLEWVLKGDVERVSIVREARFAQSYSSYSSELFSFLKFL